MVSKRIYSILAVILALAFLPFQAQAKTPPQMSSPACPPYDPMLLRDRTSRHTLPPNCVRFYVELSRRENETVPSKTILPGAISGPDDFGYTYDNTVAYNWMAASTDTGLTGDSEVSNAFDIGFNFPFYGINYSQLYFNTNGLITFGGVYSWGGGDPIPDTLTPNNLIAPFWEDLVVGSPDNSGAIYYSKGGAAPNRYLILEWREVTTYDGSSPFSFEAILHENGDIVMQQASLPALYYSTVGIENSLGDDGIEYQLGHSGLSAPKAVRFCYPIAPTARVLISPLNSSLFAGPRGNTDISVTVTNIGTQGNDTYDLTAVSTWPVAFYDSSSAVLQDTDGDSLPDTGPIPQGVTVTFIARFTSPNGATIGMENTATITATSSLNLVKSKTINLNMSIPPRFAQVLDDSNGTASLLFAGGTNGEDVYPVNPDNYFGHDPAIAPNANGKYLYAWYLNRPLGSIFVSDIEYALVKPDGSIVRPTAKLTDNSGAILDTYDFSPSVAAAPNGNMAILWERELYNSAIDQSNFNIYFAVLDGAGSLLAGPTNLTNNSVWGTWTDLNVPRLGYPTLAATDDNRFIASWEDFREVSTDLFQSDFWYAVYSTTGDTVFAPALLTTDHNNYVPTLNSLTNGNAILTYKDITPADDRRPYYVIINSSGTIVKPETSLGIGFVPNYPTDATLLSNGKIAAAWGTETGMAYSILNASYNLESGPYEVDSPTPGWGSGLSVTTDSDSHVILTWFDYDDGLLYALGDISGNFITPPMAYRTNYGDSTNMNGQGNAPFIQSSTFTDVPLDYWANTFIERLYNAGITGGCSLIPLMYCPEVNVNRAQMAVFLLRGEHGSAYVPPTVGTGTGFTDVPADYWAAAWIKQLAAEGITSGCGPNLYCPETSVTRDQMAVFLLRAEYGASYMPPPTTGAFADVPTDHWAAPWIEQLATEGITGGCGADTYCPSTPVTRAQMAVFLVRTFGLP